MEAYSFGEPSGTKYTGKDIPFYNIKKGDDFNVVIDKIANTTETARKGAIEALECFFPCPDGTEDPLVALLGKLCDLGSGDIKTDASLFGLGNNTTKFAGEVTNRSMTYSTTATSGGVVFNYNLNDFIGALPSGITLVSTNIKASGRGNTNIASTSQQAGGLTIPSANLPATIEITATINTKGGNAVFTQRIPVDAQTNVPTRKAILFPRDVSSFDNTKQLSQTDYNEILASNISNLQTRINTLLDIPLPTNNLQFANGELTTILTKLVQEVDTLKAQINNV